MTQELANPNDARRESTAMPKDRKDIYLGERLRAILKGRSENLTTIVNLIADRYLGLVERQYTPTMVAHDDILRKVLAEKTHPLNAAEIATLPAMVEDWCQRHPDYLPAPAQTFLMILRHCDYASLLALVDRIERTL